MVYQGKVLRLRYINKWEDLYRCSPPDLSEKAREYLALEGFIKVIDLKGV